MRPRVYPESRVGQLQPGAARGRLVHFPDGVVRGSSEDVEAGETGEETRWEELKVEVRAFLDSGQTLPPGFDRETLEDLLRSGHIQRQTGEVLRLWMTADPTV